MFVDGLRRRGGSTAIEAALVLPILFFLIFTIIDFARYFYTQHTIQYALREGLRTGLVGTSAGCARREDCIESTVQRRAGDMPGIDGAKVEVTMYPLTYNGTSFVDPNPADGYQDPGMGGDYMKIRVRYLFQGLTLVLGRTPRWVRADAVYRNEMF